MALSDLEASNLTSYLSWVNTESSGYMGVSILTFLWVLFFGISLARTSWGKAALIASSFNLLFALMFRLLEFVDMFVLETVMVLWILSLLAALWA